jgi:hypothetical protein
MITNIAGLSEGRSHKHTQGAQKDLSRAGLIK